MAPEGRKEDHADTYKNPGERHNPMKPILGVRIILQAVDFSRERPEKLGE